MVCEIGLSAFPEYAHEYLRKCREYQAQIVSIVMEIKDMRTGAATRLLRRVGYFLVRDGKARDGESLLAIAFSAASEVFGEEHPDTLTTMDNLASSYDSLGRTKEAAEMQEKVLEARRRIQGEEHPDTLATMHNLASSYHSLGRTKEAAEMQEKVLEANAKDSWRGTSRHADDDGTTSRGHTIPSVGRRKQLRCKRKCWKRGGGFLERNILTR